MSQLDILAILATILFVIYIYLNQGRHRANVHLPLPPGPKRRPLIGNMLDMPTSKFEYIDYHEMCKKFNTDILHLDVMGKSIIIVDTFEVATDLMEKRSSIYSSRPQFTMLNELMGWNLSFAFMKYGETWRQHRRIMHHSFHPNAATLFRPHSLKAARDLLPRLLDNPNVIEGLRHMAAQTIISIAYGVKIQQKDDPYVEYAEIANEGLFTAAAPGRFLVDTIPVLKYVPEWFPGAGFKKKAGYWNEQRRMMWEAPFEAAKEAISNGSFTPSFVSNSIHAYDENAIKGVAGTMFAGGADTTVAAIGSCILGLLENTHIIKRAQEELDRVLKPGYLPEYEDMDSLPYITAIVRECLRWRTIAPIALPHFLTVDDEYRGYRLPAGSMIVGNAWAMLHDEKLYPEPFKFNPDRFMKDGKLDPAVRDPAHAAWGFGRRICPARFMAFHAIWITLASILATCDIKKAVDENGEEIPLSHEYFPGTVHIPRPFKCSFTPRSKEMEKLIRSSTNEEF